jgi:signal transduction histidine kinase
VTISDAIGMTAGELLPHPVVMLLCSVKPFLKGVRRLLRAGFSEDLEDLADDIALQTPDDFRFRESFAPGVGLLFITTSILAIVCLDRRWALGLIVTTAFAYFLVGLLVTKGLLTLGAAEVDPHRFRNWIRVAGTTLLLGLSLVTLVDHVVGQAEASSRAAYSALAQLRRVHDRVEQAKEEERRFLAHELHDEFGQMLTSIKLRLQTERGVEPERRVQLAGDPLISTIDQLIASVRRISSQLRPPLLDEVGLVPALRAYLDGQISVSGLRIQLDVDAAGAGGRLPPDLEISCFRVVQESVTNAIRHSGARQLDITLARSAEKVSLNIRDDGRGFEARRTLDSAAAAGHLGVVGMRERVCAAGGAFHLSSQPSCVRAHSALKRSQLRQARND